MSAFAYTSFLAGIGITAGAVVLLFLSTWAVSLGVGRWNVVDTTWGLSFPLVAAVAYLWEHISGAGGDATRSTLVLVLAALWGLRLAAYIALRGRGRGEDPRYAALMEKAKGSESAYALVMIFLPQAFLSWFVSLPVQIAMYERSRPGLLVSIGGVVWAAGLVFETVGDFQMAAFRADPSNRGAVMDRGLWRYSRHPNYFGDATVWVGFYLIGASQWQGAATVLSPVAMLYFLYFKTGKGLLERNLARSKTGYAAYMARTSGFVPLPVRRRTR